MITSINAPNFPNLAELTAIKAELPNKSEDEEKTDLSAQFNVMISRINAKTF